MRAINSTRLFLLSCLILAFSFGSQSCGGGGSTILALSSITVSNQLVDFGTNPQVTISSVHSDGAGWIVVYEDAGGGTPGTQRGTAQVTDGINATVMVTLNAEATNNQSLVVALFDDQAPAGVFGAEDVPQMINGDPVQDTFVVTLPTIVAANQTLSALTTLVAITTVRSFGNGWITIHPDNTGMPDYGTTLGAITVTAGSASNVNVELDAPLMDGEMIHAALRIDQGTIGGTVEGGDTVVADNGMNDLVVPITVTVPADTPDIRLTFSSNGFNDFRLDQVTPSALAGTVVANPMTDLGSPGGNDVSISLQVGTRYEILNTVAGAHPFQFIDQNSGGSAGSDTVLLGQGAAGTLEGDVDIAWTEPSAQVIRFTVDANFMASVLGYRCGVHTTMMRGNVTVP